MLLKASHGLKGIGIGYHSAHKGFHYYRGSHGGRLFVRKYKGVLFIIGKATKKGRDNENKVMRRLEKLYGELKFLGRQGA